MCVPPGRRVGGGSPVSNAVRRLRALREESERRLRGAEAAASPGPSPLSDSASAGGERRAAAGAAAAAGRAGGAAPVLPRKRAAGDEAPGSAGPGGDRAATGNPAASSGAGAATPAAAAAAAAATGQGLGGDGAADLAAVTAVGAESGLDNPEPLLVAGAPAPHTCPTHLTMQRLQQKMFPESLFMT